VIVDTMLRGARAMASAAIPLRNINDPNQPIYQALADGGAVVTASGRVVSAESALRLIPVYSATSFIASSIAGLPIRIVRRGDETRTEVNGPRWNAINARPNPETTLMEHEEQVMLSMLLRGNAYEALFRGTGGIAERWVLDPRRVRPYRVVPDGGNEVPVDAVTRQPVRVIYRVDGVEGALTSREILHTPAMRRPGMLEGMSPIGEARESLGTALAVEEVAGRKLGTGTFIDGYLATDAVVPAAKAASLVKRWQHSHSGVSNAWRIPLLDSGAKFEPISVAMKDAQFLESRKFHATQVASLYRVAPHLIADVERSTSWGSGIAEQDIATVKYTLTPWLVRREQRLEMLIAPHLQVRFVTAALLRGTLQERYRAYALGIKGGWLSPNDVRRLEDMPPLPAGQGGDTYRTGGAADMGTGLVVPGEGNEDDREVTRAALEDAGFDPEAARSLAGIV